MEFFPLLQNYFSTFLHKNNPLLERDYSPLGPLILSWGIKKSFFFLFDCINCASLIFHEGVCCCCATLYICLPCRFLCQTFLYIYSMALLVEELRYLKIKGTRHLFALCLVHEIKHHNAEIRLVFNKDLSF